MNPRVLFLTAYLLYEWALFIDDVLLWLAVPPILIAYLALRYGSTPITFKKEPAHG